MVILWIAFFLSGIAGLAYEITWMRYLHQLLGASTPAVSATISIFFAGMALGAVWGGRFFDRHPHPLRLYARLEVLIALSASAVPFLFQAADALLPYLPSHHEHPALLLALSTAILCVPATLIGAVFPAMAAVVRHLPNPTHATGYFYGFNTLGAVVGCFVVAFWWLPYAGQAVTTWSMALLNLAIALWLRTLPSPANTVTSFDTKQTSPSDEGVCHTPRQKVDVSASHVPPRHPRAPCTDHAATATPCEDAAPNAESGVSALLPRRLFLILAATSGLLSISLEVLWTRSLSLVLPTSVADFGLVMSAYLLGVGIGSLWIGWRARTRPPSPTTLWRAYLAIAMTSLLPVLCFPYIPAWRSTLLAAYDGFSAHHGVSWRAALFFDNFFAFLLMFPVTFLMGIALPILIGLATQDRRHTGRTAGQLYAINTVGSILGSLAVAFWWMPTYGIAESLWLIAVAYGVMALAILVHRPAPAPFSRFFLSAALVMALWVWQQDRCPQINLAKHQPQKRLLFYKDATALTLAVYETPTPRDTPPHRSLAINNDDDTTSTQPRDLRRQYLLGHFSYALHTKAQRVLLFGLSNGSTLAALAQHPFREIQCVEKHPLLSHIAPLFQHANLSVWKDPRVRIFHNKKHRFLQRTQQSYDLIIDDLFRPSADLDTTRFSASYLATVQQRLHPDGIYISWLPLHRLSPHLLASLLPAFLRSFPHTQLFVADWDHRAPLAALVASRRVLRPAPFAQKQHVPSFLQPIHQALHTIHPASFEPLLSHKALVYWAQQAKAPHNDASLRAAILHDQLQRQQHPSFAQRYRRTLRRLCSFREEQAQNTLCDLTHTPWRPMHARFHPPLSPTQKPLHNTTYLRAKHSGHRDVPAAFHSLQYTVERTCHDPLQPCSLP